MTRRPLCLVCLFMMIAMCLADWLGMPLIRGNPLPESVRAWINEQQECTICGEVERCTSNEFSQSVFLKEVCLIDQSVIQSKRISIGNVRVFLKSEEKVPAGALILVSGKLEEVEGPRNPGEFDSRQYYACQRIFYFMKKGVIEKKTANYSGYGQFLLDMQGRFGNVLKRVAKEAAPMFSAIVLGDKSELENETKMRYQMAGIIHILAISGLHISMLGVGLYKLLMRTGMGIWPSGLVAFGVMLQYGMMTGGSVSTMRAVCMFLISVGAKILGRIYDGMTALAVTAILILMDSPAYLYSSGFLLSFGAVIGIGAAAPALCGCFGVDGKRGKSGKIAKTFLSSLGVQLVTLPVMLWFFGEVSVAGIFLNLVVLPSVGVALASGVGAAILGGVSVRLGCIAALPGRGLLWAYEWLCRAAGAMPWCTWIGGRPEMWQVIVYYGILAAVLWGGVRIRKVIDNVQTSRCAENKLRRYDSSRLRRNLVAVSGVCLLCVAVTVLGFRPYRHLEITCLDVGQGDGIVVETPEKYCFLIDCGSSNKSGVGQYRLLPYLKYKGISVLDGIFISHTDEDHISGVRELLEFMGKGLTSIRVKTLVLPSLTEPPKAWKELADLAKKAGVKVVQGYAGNGVRAGKVQFAFLSPPKEFDKKSTFAKADAVSTGASVLSDINENALVLSLVYGNFRALFTGDIGTQREKELLRQGLLGDVDFLKVGHHGSRYSTGEDFLQKIRSETAVISCSQHNTYGHPAAETIERLENAGCRVFFTMKSGAVTVVTDGIRTGVDIFLR